jgi:hypothetical protein
MGAQLRRTANLPAHFQRCDIFIFCCFFFAQPKGVCRESERERASETDSAAAVCVPLSLHQTTSGYSVAPQKKAT